MPAPTDFPPLRRLLTGLCAAGALLSLPASGADSGPYRLRLANPDDYRLRTGNAAPPGRPRRPPGLSALIDRHAAAHGLDPALVHAVVGAESAYRPSAVSPKGAVGLMQVMPAIGRRFGVADLSSPEANLRAGTAYLSQLIARFGELPLALAAYNAGEGAVLRHGRSIPPYPETRAYVAAVLRAYRRQPAATVPARGSSYLDGTRLRSVDPADYRLRRPDPRGHTPGRGR